MGKDYNTDAEQVAINAWACTTCGKFWPVTTRNKRWTAADAENAARHCCSKNSPCHLCGKPTSRAYTACDACRAKLRREQWEACEVKPLEFPLTIQDSDEWFFDEDALLEYCYENEVKPGELLLRIGVPSKPRRFEPEEFWCDYINDDYDPTDNNECRELADKINEWAEQTIHVYDVGPFRPDVSGLESEE
jgi:hypothetical protein